MLGLSLAACPPDSEAPPTSPPPSDPEDAGTGDAGVEPPPDSGTGDAGIEPPSDAGTGDGGIPYKDFFAVAVGKKGLIVHCTAAGCSTARSPVTTSLNDVAVLSPSRAFIAGSGGVILEWDGVAWTQASTQTTLGLISIDAVAGKAVAVGEQGIILESTGGPWAQVASPVSARGPDFMLRSVDLLDSSFGFAVGGQRIGAGGKDGVIIRLDGARWILDRSGEDADLDSVGVGGRDVAAAGGWAEAAGRTLHLLQWNGTSWARVAGLPYQNYVTGVAFGSSQFGMLVTDGNLADAPFVGVWSGASWSVSSTGDAGTYSLADVHLVDEQLGLAVGWANHLNPVAPVLRWDGTQWTALPVNAPQAVPLFGVSMVPTW